MKTQKCIKLESLLATSYLKTKRHQSITLERVDDTKEQENPSIGFHAAPDKPHEQLRKILKT